MKITAVIPTLEKNTPYLKNCVESLRATTDWDIIVVSNGSKTYPIDAEGITIRVHTEQQGQCNAVNVGAKLAAANTDYIFVANDDMYFAPGWNKNLGRALRLDNGYKVFSPNLIEPVEIPSAPPFLKFDGGDELTTFKKEAVDKFVAEATVPPGVDEHVVVEIPDGHSIEEDGFNLPFFVRKDVWYTIGGYDTKYDPWGSNSDTDLQTLFELAGVKPQRLRDVLVYHFGSKSGTFTPEKQEYWQKNFDYYTEKFGFNRDQLGSDTWYCKNMIDYGKLKFRPVWLDKYKGEV